MRSLSIDADIQVHLPAGHRSYAPGTAEELMLIAVDLLVHELGNEGSRSFIEQVLERYAPHAAAMAIEPAAR